MRIEHAYATVKKKKETEHMYTHMWLINNYTYIPGKSLLISNKLERTPDK